MFGDTRAQAYTLEGFIGSILVLTAVLFALQSVVITPTTSGTVDRDARDQVRVEAKDMLTLGAESGNLSAMIRYWNGTEAAGDRQFASTSSSIAGYRDELPPPDAPRGTIMMIQDAFEDKNGYNIQIVYQGKNGETQNGTLDMVKNGGPLEDGVVATYRITLYDDQRLTGPGGEQRPLSWYDTVPDNGDNGYYPIPDAYPNSPVYNVVIVKVIVW